MTTEQKNGQLYLTNRQKSPPHCARACQLGFDRIRKTKIISRKINRKFSAEINERVRNTYDYICFFFPGSNKFFSIRLPYRNETKEKQTNNGLNRVFLVCYVAFVCLCMRIFFPANKITGTNHNLSMASPDILMNRREQANTRNLCRLSSNSERRPRKKRPIFYLFANKTTVDRSV